MKSILLPVIFLFFSFQSCKQKDASKMFLDDNGSFLELGCVSYNSCDNKNSILINVYLKDLEKRGEPDFNRSNGYHFCCNNLLALIDSTKTYGTLMTKLKVGLKGKTIGSIDIGTSRSNPYPHEFYSTDSNRIALGPTWKLNSDSTGNLTFNDMEFIIAGKESFIHLSFNSEKSLKIFTDSLQNVYNTCCLQ